MVRSSNEWIPKPVDVKEDSGNMVTGGDSGDELGDGSVRGEESAVDIVVVGEESVDSEARVEVLSRCLCWRCGVGLMLTSRGESMRATTSEWCGDSARGWSSMVETLLQV